MSEKRDVELLKEIERIREELADEKKKLRTVLDSIVDGVYTTDIEKRITFWNKGAERITGFKAGDVVGKPCKMLLNHMDDSGNSLCDTACPLSETMQSSDPVYGKNVNSGTVWGHTTPVSVSCAPIIDHTGETVGAIEVFRDISEQKKLEKQKAEFFSMITHDIKSPLTVILGYTDLLMNGDIPKDENDKMEYIKNIDRAARHIKELSDNFLSISTLNTGNTELHRGPMVIQDMLKRVCNDFSPAAGSKGIELSFKAQSGLPTIYVDVTMIYRALSNLTGNALKFTPPGGSVMLTASDGSGGHTDGTHHTGCLNVTVTDTGQGIPPDEQPRVFDTYYRLADSAGIEGTGLGLAIVRAICESHGGSVSLKSVPGEGSAFTISIPYDKPADGR